MSCRVGAAGLQDFAPFFVSEFGERELRLGNLGDDIVKQPGDSGGPSFIDVGTGRDPVVELVSLTSRAGDPDCNPSVIETRVRACATWIEETVSALRGDSSSLTPT